MPAHAQRVVILGGGFGGLWATRALASAPVQVTLVDRTNHHLFQPLLYQVALAGLSAPDIAAPLHQLVGIEGAAPRRERPAADADAHLAHARAGRVAG